MKMQSVMTMCFLMILMLMIPHINGQGCVAGFFMSTGSKQCFKLFKDIMRNFYEAKKKCEEEGLLHAKPDDGVAVNLRKDILNRYGNTSVWVDACSNGEKFVWHRDNTELRENNPLWHPGFPSYRTILDHCVFLSAWENDYIRNPGSPYATYDWSAATGHTLCEACTSDSHCQTKEICEGGKCTNVCFKGACRENEACTVEVLSGFKTPICTCPNGFFIDSDQLCKKAGCIGHSDCGDNKRCQSGSCVDPCDLITCGEGARCRVLRRRPQCICPTFTQGNPLVRCQPTPEAIPAAFSIITGTVQPGTINTLKNTTEASCGHSTTVDERITNGRQTIAGKYPWMVHLEYFSSFAKRLVSCGGTLISRGWVLTAAHCFRDLEPHINIILKIGFVDRKRQDPGSSLFQISPNDIVIHEEFSASTLENDIALARLPEDVTLSNVIQTICLGTNQHIPFGRKAYAAGWGLLNPNDPDIPNVLHEVELDVLPDASPSCKNSQHFICTFTPGKDTCSGDSGGPLMIQQGDQWFQVGIVSSGPLDCGHNESPGVYTRVPNHMLFITSNIRL